MRWPYERVEGHQYITDFGSRDAQWPKDLSQPRSSQQTVAALYDELPYGKVTQQCDTAVVGRITNNMSDNVGSRGVGGGAETTTSASK